MTTRKPPVLIELDDEAAGPESAPQVPEPDRGGQGAAMLRTVSIAARAPSRLRRWAGLAFGALVSFVLAVTAWDFVQGLLARNPVLGWIAAALVAAVVMALLVLALREWAALARLRRLDRLRQMAEAALASGELGAARDVGRQLEALYAGRPDLAWARGRMAERRDDLFDADGVLGLAEVELMTPLDQAARREIEAAARQVAAVTALVPLALADVAAALLGNLRMIRRIAEIYGGRAGTFGSWRLARAVMGHLVATGAVAVGDDLIGSVAGGGLLAKVSRRFGEGVVNGALTARVGVAAMEVCRPLPFRRLPKPRVTNLVSRGLAGLFGRTDTTGT